MRLFVDRGVVHWGAGIFPHEQVYLAAADTETGWLSRKNDAISIQNAERDDRSSQRPSKCRLRKGDYATCYLP